MCTMLHIFLIVQFYLTVKFPTNKMRVVAFRKERFKNENESTWPADGSGIANDSM